MSRWRFLLNLDSDLALLQDNPAAYEWNADGPLLQIDVSTIDAREPKEEDIFSTLFQAVRAHSFAASGKGGEVPPIPAPWGVWVKPAAIPSAQDWLAAELALELWLIPSRDINDFDAAKRSLQERNLSLQEDVREALAYWLLSSTHPLGGRPDLKKSWRSDTDEVLVRRSAVWVNRRRPNEPLLAAAQRLLEEFTRLRNAAVTLANYDEMQNVLGAEITPLPEAFRQAIWWEAGYQLAERGLHQEADIAAQRYRQACDRLLARLPGLADGSIPGFGVSVGQRAYYAGEFYIALDAYRKEWESGSEQHRSRLKRLFANIFCDLGAHSAAKRMADDALAEQEVAGDPETYKTLGRCGEIALRFGNFESAADFYRRSHELQHELLGSQSLTGQTAVYRGHAALLAGNMNEAADWYVEAHRADALKDSRLNAYALMGDAALALRQNDTSAVIACLDRLENTENSLINGDALPRAVITLATVIVGAPREKGLASIKELLNNNYMAEALVLLPLVYSNVGMANEALNRIADSLQKWSKALAELQELVGDTLGGEPTPDAMLNAITAVKKGDHWQPLNDLQSRIFPANLVTNIYT